MAKVNWDKAKRVTVEPDPGPIRPSAGRLVRFQQAGLKRQAAARRDTAEREKRVELCEWLLLDADKRVLASVWARSEDEARTLFKAKGLTGAWLREVQA